MQQRIVIGTVDRIERHLQDNPTDGHIIADTQEVLDAANFAERPMCTAFPIVFGDAGSEDAFLRAVEGMFPGEIHDTIFYLEAPDKMEDVRALLGRHGRFIRAFIALSERTKPRPEVYTSVFISLRQINRLAWQGQESVTLGMSLWKHEPDARLVDLRGATFGNTAWNPLADDEATAFCKRIIRELNDEDEQA